MKNLNNINNSTIKPMWMDLAVSKGISHLFIFILFLFTIVAIVSAVGTYQISIQGSKDLLETHAVDIAVNVGFSIERKGFKKDLFQKIVNSDRWEDLAFLALYNENGKILLHSNPHLIGKKVWDSRIKQVIKNEHPSTHFEILATGEKVFVLDFPLKLSTSKNPSEHDIYCLRVALHTYPAQDIVRRANVQLVLITVSLAILWLISFFFIWMWNRNIKLQKMLEHQERLAALGQMSAVLAHEIRNPLSSIKGFAQYHLETQKDNNLKEDMKIIVKEAQRLENLTNNLLAYARPLKIQETTFNIKSICESIKLMFADKLDNIKFHINCTDEQITTDENIITQIILNLIQNAIEALADKKEGNIWLRIWLDGNILKLVIEDDGAGIPKDIREHIFEPFVTNKTKGTGLGLAIVKRQLDALNGQIEIKDRKPCGTIAILSIPVEIAEEDILGE